MDATNTSSFTSQVPVKSPLSKWWTHVPEIAEDETLYSLVARWYVLSGAARTLNFFNEFSGAGHRRKQLDALSSWPYKFVSRLPVDNPLHCIDQPIKCFTSLPYYLYPYPAAVRDQWLRPKFPIDDLSGIKQFLHVVRSPFHQSRGPYACLDCLEEDLSIHGFSWWRRAHQLRGIGRCHRHGGALVMGCLHCGLWVTARNPIVLPSLRCRCGRFKPFEAPEAAWCSPEKGAAVARFSAHMLMDDSPPDPFRMRAALRRAIVDRHASEESSERLGSSVWKALGRELVASYGPAYLSRREGTALRTASRWSRGCCGKEAKQYPVERYVILGQHLFGSLAAMKTAIASLAGGHPWDNPDAKNTNQAPIPLSLGSGSILRDAPFLDSDRNMRGADEAALAACALPESFTSYDTSLVIQPLTHQERAQLSMVKELYKNNVLLKEIGLRTGLGRKAIAKIIDASPELRRSRSESRFVSKRSQHRHAILDLAGLGASRSVIREKLPAAILWIEKNDREWLAEHMPQVRRFRGKREVPTALQVDWVVKDMEWSSMVAEAVQDIIEGQRSSISPVKPYTVIQRMRWASRMGALSSAEHRMPRTWAALSMFCESVRAYKLRRFVWLVGKHFRAGRPFPIRTVCTRAGIKVRELEQYLWLTGYDMNKPSPPDPF